MYHKRSLTSLQEMSSEDVPHNELHSPSNPAVLASEALKTHGKQLLQALTSSSS